MKLYIIRHGESENNLNGCYTGWSQVSLTEKGFKDAEDIRDFLCKIKFDKIYTSDLIRAKQTAETAIPECTYEETPLIREINLGELNGQKMSVCAEKYGEEFLKNKAVRNFVPYGGEDAKMLEQRVQHFLDKVSETSFETVAAFAHAGVLKAALGCVLKTALPHPLIKCANCTVAIFEFKDGKWLFGGWISPSEM